MVSEWDRSGLGRQGKTGRGIRLVVLSTACLSVIGLFLGGCAGLRSEGFPISLDSVTPGEGETVYLHEKAFSLEGQTIRVNEPAPDVSLLTTELTPMGLEQIRGRVKIVSVVPSLDTPVCEEQTHILSERNGGLDKKVDLITVSMDLPFAQKRFSQKAGIENVLFLSDHQGADFGRAYGLLIPELRLLSRAVLVLDRNNIIRHIQVVPKLEVLPDMDAAFQVARELL